MRILVCLFGALILFICSASGQVDSTAYHIAQFPNKLFANLNSKASSLDDALTKQTEKCLARLAKKERKIRAKLYKIDSNAAKNLFNGSQEKYATLQNNFSNASSVGGTALTGEYAPYVDSMKSSLAFAQKNLLSFRIKFNNILICREMQGKMEIVTSQHFIKIWPISFIRVLSINRNY